MRPLLSMLVLSMVLWPAPGRGQSQLEMTSEACADYKAADRELNLVYQKVLDRYEKDVFLIGKLKQAQRAWIAFRDAELVAIYPLEDKRTEYGSAHPMCECTQLASLTRDRIKLLMTWLEVQEGDVCSGSRTPNSP